MGLGLSLELGGLNSELDGFGVGWLNLELGG
jgi:hypothetical protein